MNYQQQQFSGPGWDSLQRAMDKSQFVLIGEQHGLAEVPKLTSALAQVFLPKLYVAEIDPYTALVLERTAKEPGLPIALERSHPFSLSFYSWAEEFELARQLSAQKVKIIGLDQVCFLATGRIYAQMARAVKGKAAKRYLQERAAALQAHDIAYFRNPAIGQAAIFQLSAAAIDSLLDITKYEKPYVRKMA